MFCVPVTDAQYRRAARLAGFPEWCLEPIPDEQVEEMRAAVDAVLAKALRTGLDMVEAELISSQKRA